MGYSLSEAAKAVGLSRPTVHRAIKTGKLSATRREDGSYLIDESELFRVFPTAVSNERNVSADLRGNETAVLRAEIEMLHERCADKDARLAEKDGVIADLREDRDRWREQATRLLPPPQPEPRRGWWPWGRDKG